MKTIENQMKVLDDIKQNNHIQKAITKMKLEEGSSTVQKLGQVNSNWEWYENELEAVWDQFGMRKEKEHGIGIKRIDTAERKRLKWIYEVKTPEILDDSITEGKPKVNPHKLLLKEGQKNWLKKRN